ncbi:MAG: RIP metalloprotease RseP [Alphaproteobacteria bacterium]|nr:RIP metalloprotease RseP [Alphaproteobacteria bacterium]
MLLVDYVSLLSKTGQFILCISILVVLHEFGHFLPAKIFKCRVEKFYLFFNPWRSLFKKKIGETEYGIGWLPFGGYVKISGMIDESLDKSYQNQDIQPYEFRAKPAWQRLIIMIGGVTVNVILAIIIFILLNYNYGKNYISNQDLTDGYSATPNAVFLGLKQGDKIQSINNIIPSDFTEIEQSLRTNPNSKLVILRKNQTAVLNITQSQINQLPQPDEIILNPSIPMIIDSVTPKAKFGLNSYKLQKGDRIIGLNKINIDDEYAFATNLPKFKNQFNQLTIIRNNHDTLLLSVFTDEFGKLNIFKKAEAQFFNIRNQNYSFFESCKYGVIDGQETLANQINGFKDIFSGKRSAKESLGSVISIGNLFPTSLDWKRFWVLTAVLSLVLAFINILPIPALDGGHALFILFEMISGKKPSDKFLENAQIVGFVLLLALMAYALGLDFWRLFQ